MLHNLKVLLGANTKLMVVRPSGKFDSKLQQLSTLNQSINKCWKCGTENSNHIQFQCSKCQSLLSLPSNVNHFELLNINATFSIDSADLTRKFRKIQSVLHPDKYSNASDTEQNLSAEWSSLVNKAYRILLSPIQRAEYLLKLHGVIIPEGNTVVNTEFLMKMMERNEEVDDAESREDLVKLLNTVKDDCKACILKLEKSLTINDNLSEATANVIELRYLLSLENSIKDKGSKVGIFL